MARRGGSGGRSSGGSFGGSRSSGGRIGGSFGRSRSGSSGRTGSLGGGLFGGSRRSGSSGGSLFGGIGRPGIPGGIFGGIRKPVNPEHMSQRPIGAPEPPRRETSSFGCGMFFIVLVAIGVVALLLYGMSSNFRGPGGTTGITTSTVRRQALPAGSVDETDYYTDELGWINNRTELISGLKYFYQKTGVQPHLYITDTINGSHHPSTDDLDAFANELYDQLFTDEAHLLLVFFEYGDGYMDRYVCGTQAKTVIDTEAADILLDYLDRNYYDDGLTDEQFFSRSFSGAADRIMTVTRSPWIPAIIVTGIVVLAAILFTWWKHSKNQKNLEAQRTEEILKAPLETFGDTEAEKLAKKYEDA